MKWIHPVSANEARLTGQVGQKAVPTPEFRHTNVFTASQETVGTLMIPCEISSAFRPNHLIQIQVACIFFPEYIWPDLFSYIKKYY